MRTYSLEESKEIYQNAQEQGLDADRVMSVLVSKGNVLEGVDMNEARTVAQEKYGLGLARTQPLGSETMDDLRQIGVEGAQAFEQAAADQAAAKEQKQAGEISGARNVLRQVGASGRALSGSIGAALKGGVKALLSTKGEAKVKGAVEDVVTGAVESKFGQQASADWQAFKERNPEAAQDIADAFSIAEVGADIAGVGLAGKGTKGAVKVGKEAIETSVEQVVKEGADVALDTAQAANKIKTTATDFTKGIKDTADDVLAEFSPQQLSERNFAKSFKLAANDVVELDDIVGGPISEWAIANNLIKGTSEETVEEMIKFKLKNYNTVRDAIGTIDETFSFKDVPEIENMLDDIIKKTEGFESNQYKTINNQLKTAADKFNSGEASLSDVQFVKGAFDDIESIFKRSGATELKTGLKFQDLGASRREVQKFIENIVAEKLPGVDIKELNRNVRASRGLVDDIAKRAGKFDTQSSASLGDYFVFGLGQQVAPGFGPGVFALKKVVESAPIRLRLTKLLSKGKNRVSETDIKEIQRIIGEEIEGQIDIRQ